MNHDLLKGREPEIHSKASDYYRCFIAAAISLLLLFTNTVSVYAEDKWPSLADVSADSYVVMDLNTGNILLEKNSGKRVHPASLTKIMTAVLGLENLTLEQEITVSKAAASLPDSESTIDLISGEIVTFKELLHGLLMASGNDAAIAIGEKVGGNTASFITLMNKKSKEIGAMNSSWNNPQGITAEAHYSTSYDLAVITRYALAKEWFRKVVDTPVYSMATTNKHPYSGWNVLENTNKLMRFQEDIFASDRIYKVSGVKTGTTTAAGSNLIATAHVKNGLQLICVLNGVRGDQSKNLWAFMRTLIIEASKVTDGVQTVLTENTGITAGNDTGKWFPDQSFSLYIGKNPAIDVLVEKTGNDLLVKTKSDNKLLFSTKASSGAATSGNASTVSSSTAVSTQSKPATSGSSENTDKTSNLFILLFGVIILIGICCVLILVKSLRKKSSKSDKYYINRK